MINFTYSITPPANINNKFGNFPLAWFNAFNKTDRARIRIGVSALCLSIWMSWNDIILNK
jgi:hypothetical protein